MTAALFTAGPWAWDESRSTLRPLNPDPSRSAVHTILGPDGPVGFMDSDHRATLAEAEGNFRLIELAPQLLMALQACVACMKAPQLFSRRHKPTRWPRPSSCSAASWWASWRRRTA